jgi:RNA polymerase sigma factor (TIGR02999 family)
MSNITRILSAIDQGDQGAAGQLLPLVYNELRKLAAQKMAHEQAGQTLDATGLVHEAYLRLVGSSDRDWDNRRHFFAAAAEAMRRILVESARRRQRIRHGGGRQRVDLDDVDLAVDVPVDELLVINEALEELSRADANAAELVKLRYFAGMTVEQAAQTLGIPARTAYRNWAYARAWLFRQTNESGEVAGSERRQKGTPS